MVVVVEYEVLYWVPCYVWVLWYTRLCVKCKGVLQGCGGVRYSVLCYVVCGHSMSCVCVLLGSVMLWVWECCAACGSAVLCKLPHTAQQSSTAQLLRLPHTTYLSLPQEIPPANLQPRHLTFKDAISKRISQRELPVPATTPAILLPDVPYAVRTLSLHPPVHLRLQYNSRWFYTLVSTSTARH